MSSFERFAAFSQWCEGSDAAFETSSASAEKSRAAPPIPNANTEAVPRINFLIIVAPVLLKSAKSSSYCSKQSRQNAGSFAQVWQIWDMAGWVQDRKSRMAGA